MIKSEKATEFLQKFSDWIQDATLFSYIFKWISGSWVKGLYKLASGVEDILDQVFKVFGFLNNGTIGKIYTSMRVLSLTVLIIMIIVLAYKFILNERVDLKAGLFRAVLFVCLGVQLPGMITSSVNLAQKVYGQTKNLDTADKSTLSYSIVKENLADLQYASKNGFSRLNKEAGTKKNNLSEQGFKATDLTEIITPDNLEDMKKNAKNEQDVSYLEYKLKTDEDGKITSKKIENGMFDFFKEGKFRFSYKTGTITLSLITVSFAFICSAFIIATSLIELIFAKLMFPILSVADIETGQRTKKIFLDMGSSLLAIMLTGFSLSIFKLYFAYIGSLNVDFLPYLVLCIVGVRITIDGPNFFGKFLGIDIGVRSGWQALMGTAVAAKAATGMMKSGVNTAKSIKDGASGTMNRMKVNNGVHESNNNDKSIQNQSKSAMGQQPSRSGLQSLVSNVRQAFGSEDQMDPETESNGSARSNLPTQPKNEASIAQNNGEGNSSAETDSLSQMNDETPDLSSMTKTSVSNGISSDPSLSPNGQGKSIRSISPNDLNKMGQNGQRSALKNEAVSNGITAAGNQNNQRSTIPSVQSPERKEAIKAAANKVNQNQEDTDNDSAEAHVSMNRTNDQEAIQTPSEVTYGDSKDQISDFETKGSQMSGQYSQGYTPGNFSHQESNSVTGRSSSVTTTGNNKPASAGVYSQQTNQTSGTGGSTTNERHSSAGMSADSVTGGASRPAPQSVSNQVSDRTVVSAPNKHTDGRVGDAQIIQDTAYTPEGNGSVTVERHSGSSASGSTASYVSNQSGQQEPSQAIDRTVVSASNRPTSGGNKVVQESVHAPNSGSVTVERQSSASPSSGSTTSYVSHQAPGNAPSQAIDRTVVSASNRTASGGNKVIQETVHAPQSGSVTVERHSGSNASGSATSYVSSQSGHQAPNQAIDRTVVSTSNRPTSGGNKVVQESVHAPNSGSVTVERQSSASPSSGSTTSYVSQAPSQAIDRTVVSTSNRPTSGGNKIVQETVQAPGDHRTRKDKVVSKKTPEKPTHETIIETKHKEAASPAELAKKYLKDSGVSPESAFFDSYESINRIKADDYI